MLFNNKGKEEIIDPSDINKYGLISNGQKKEGLSFSINPTKFNFCQNLENDIIVRVPEGYTTLSTMCFLGTGYPSEYTINFPTLKKIYLSSTINEIQQDAFMGCINLEEIIFPENIQYTIIESGTFQNCGIKRITLPQSVEEIGDYAFALCSKLEEVSIPEGVVVIGAGAFVGTALEEIEIPSTVTIIGEQCFADINMETQDLIPNTTLKKIKIHNVEGSIEVPEDKWGAPDVEIIWLGLPE